MGLHVQSFTEDWAAVNSIAFVWLDAKARVKLGVANAISRKALKYCSV